MIIERPPADSVPKYTCPPCISVPIRKLYPETDSVRYSGIETMNLTYFHPSTVEQLQQVMSLTMCRPVVIVLSIGEASSIFTLAGLVRSEYDPIRVDSLHILKQVCPSMLAIERLAH